MMKANTFLGDSSSLFEGENLKTAAIGEDSFLPLSKLMQATELFDEFVTRAGHQVISITQNHLGTGLVYF